MLPETPPDATALAAILRRARLTPDDRVLAIGTLPPALRTALAPALWDGSPLAATLIVAMDASGAGLAAAAGATPGTRLLLIERDVPGRALPAVLGSSLVPLASERLPGGGDMVLAIRPLPGSSWEAAG